MTHLKGLCGAILVLFLFVGIFATACNVSGCGGAAVRDPVVYETEIDFIEKAVDEQVRNTELLILEYCACEVLCEGCSPEFVSEMCDDAAHTVQILKARMPWHLDMMRFLGGIADERPDAGPPDAGISIELCTKGVTVKDLGDKNPYGKDKGKVDK